MNERKIEQLSYSLKNWTWKLRLNHLVGALNGMTVGTTPSFSHPKSKIIYYYLFEGILGNFI